jgi:hypothetical protein
MMTDKAVLVEKIMLARKMKILEVMCDYAPAELDAVAGKRRCVLATRVAIETLARYGIAAEPLEVEVIAVNASWLKVAQREGATEADFLAVDARYVRTDIKLEPGEVGFPGHVVARIVGDEQIVDLDVKQYKRPTIAAPDAAVFTVGADFFVEDRPAVFPLPNGAQLAYKRITDGIDRKLREAPGRLAR